MIEQETTITLDNCCQPARNPFHKRLNLKNLNGY